MKIIPGYRIGSAVCFFAEVKTVGKTTTFDPMTIFRMKTTLDW